ncbi:MAG: hypothetical protein WAN22_08720 [Solirubrobacteraceae bacterium]
MNSYLNNQLARAPQAEVRMGLATPDDGAAVGRLTPLDSSSVPTPPLLLAEQGGEVRVAVSLSGTAVIPDPSHPTAALVELLQTRAPQLDRQHAPKQRSIRPARAGLQVRRGHSAAPSAFWKQAA